MSALPELTLAQTLTRAHGTLLALEGKTGFARVHLVAQLLADLNRLEREGVFHRLAELLGGTE
jgi:hypothetical protein